MEPQRKSSAFWAAIGKLILVIVGVWAGIVLGYIISLLTGLKAICG